MPPAPPLHAPQPRERLRAFLLFYGLLILLGSLYPFSRWAVPDFSPLQFLTAPWPRYITRTDLATNLLSYLPVGYAFALWFSLPGHRSRGVVLGVMAGALLSFACESLQQLLPGRIASNLDLLVNTLGALLGALLAVHHSRWLRAGAAMRRWRQRWFRAGLQTNLGLALLLAWLLGQFTLVPMPGLGWLHLHLRPLDMPPEGIDGLNVAWFATLFLELLAVGAFTACLLRPGRYVAALVLVVAGALLGKLLVATILLKLSVIGGILSLETLAAFILAFWLLLLPSVSRQRWRFAFAVIGLVLLTRLLLAPDFLPRASALNVVGLAKYLSAFWPPLALGWLGWWRLGAAKPRTHGPG